MFKDKIILITGGTGSLGKELTRIILNEYSNIKKLIIFSRDEQKQFQMSQEFSEIKYPQIRYFIGNVRDLPRLKRAFQDVDYVIHAAAMKHVPIAEYNPNECIKTNVGGAQNVIDASLANSVQNVVALSTDKACAPINLYGATKLTSDKLFVAANNIKGFQNIKFSVVRYGNVVGSRGSVVPFFEKLKKDKSSTIPITDTRMTRFWISLQQGVDFVIKNFQRMHGGEIFIPKLPSMRITDLAEAVLPGCKHKVIGIRPGEKLHEVMIPLEEARVTLELGSQYLIEPAFSFWSSENYLDQHNGSRVDENFEYSSNTNKDWISTEELREIIAKI